jgi:hypothetical protein
MTANEIRRIVLSLPETEERAHMHHPDFRVRGKIFATLGYPDKHHAMVKLFPDQQQELIRESPEVFWAKGSWGEKGATLIRLKAAEKAQVEGTIRLAWENWAPKDLLSAGMAAASTSPRSRAKSSRRAPRRRVRPR